MNKEIEDKAKLLNQWILQQECDQEFKKYEELLHNNKELYQLEKELKKMQQDIVNAKHHNLNCDALVDEYSLKKKSFDENPLVYNYLVYKQEVNELLSLIQNDINRQLKKKVD